MELLIIALILVSIVIHKYLSTLYDLGTLPHSMGFILFANFLFIIWFTNFIFMFGWVIGIIISILAFFSIIHMTFLWPLILPWVLRLQKDISAVNVNNTFYGFWSLLVLVLGGLTIINFFTSEYRSLNPLLMKFLNEYYIPLIIFAIVSNLLRHTIQVKLVSKER
jgi:hypothetical protein